MDQLRELRGRGRAVVAGNTDIAVADFDYAAAFPWLDGRRPGHDPAAAEWAHDQLGDEQLEWLAACRPSAASASTTRWSSSCHASPGSQTQGFDKVLDATVDFERASRTDARVICVGHTHLARGPRAGLEGDRQRRLAGYVFDGDPRLPGR